MPCLYLPETSTHVLDVHGMASVLTKHTHTGHDPLSPSASRGLPPWPFGKAGSDVRSAGGCGASTFAPPVGHSDQNRHISSRPKPEASLGILSSSSLVTSAAVLSAARSFTRSTWGPGRSPCCLLWLAALRCPAGSP